MMVSGVEIEGGKLGSWEAGKLGGAAVQVY